MFIFAVTNCVVSLFLMVWVIVSGNPIGGAIWAYTSWAWFFLAWSEWKRGILVKWYDEAQPRQGGDVNA